MTVVITKRICDVCKNEVKSVTEVDYPVIFHTEQTEGKSCSPYISKQRLDLCDKCAEKVLMLHGWGAMGINRYSVHEESKGE